MKVGDVLYAITGYNSIGQKSNDEIKIVPRTVRKVGRIYLYTEYSKYRLDDLWQVSDFGTSEQLYRSSRHARAKMDKMRIHDRIRRDFEYMNAFSRAKERKYSTDQLRRIEAILDEEQA